MSERICGSCRHWRKYDGAGVAGSCRRRAPVGAGDWPETTGADWCGEWEWVDVAKESVKDVVPCRECGGEPVVVYGNGQFLLKCRNACPNKTGWFHDEKDAWTSWDDINLFCSNLAERIAGARSGVYSVAIRADGKTSVICDGGVYRIELPAKDLLELAKDIVRRAESKM